MNINILFEVVEKDPILTKTNFDFEDEDDVQATMYPMPLTGMHSDI